MNYRILILSFLIGSPICAAYELKSAIDMHVHAACLEEGDTGCYVSPKMQNSYKFNHYLAAFGTSVEEVKKEGSGIVVENLHQWVLSAKYTKQAIVLALDGVYDENGKWNKELTDVLISNKFIYENTKDRPELLFGASIHPNRPDAIEKLEFWAERGAKLIKWIPSLLRLNPANEKYTEFYLKMKELGLILLSHTGDEHSFGEVDNSLADPTLLKLPLSIGVTVIAAHTGITGSNEGQTNFSRLIPMLKAHDNLYADISSATQINHFGDFQMILREEGIQHKLLFASDFPLINTPLVSPWWHIFKTGFSENARIRSFENPFDRDIELKKALGMSDELLYRNLFSILARPVSIE